MKHLRKLGAVVIVCLLIMQTVFISGFTTLADTSSAVSSLPITYELYDYFEDAEASRVAGTAIASDSPWKFQAKPAGGTWTDWLDTASRGSDQYTYWNKANTAWGNYPGIAYYLPEDRSGRYYQNYISPTNSANSTEWKIDAAYVFTAPSSGSYSFGKGNQDKSASWDLCNYFKQYDSGEKLDFGVRITMNGKILWNGDSTAEKRDGFAVFGTNTAVNQSIEIPSMDGVVMNEGDILRVEFTAFDGANAAPWCLRITGTVAMKLVSLSTRPSVFPIDYELYDYYNDIESARKNQTAVSTTSPWSIQVKQPNADWQNWGGNYARDNGYTYVYNSDKAWGMYPGYAYYYPDDYSSGRLYLGMISPTNSDADAAWEIDSAYTFTVPYDGIYTLRPCNQDMSIAWDDTNNFKQYGSDAALNFGVRITKNGEVIWNGDSTTEKQDDFAVFGSGGAAASSIAVPTLSALNLKFGDVIRVEFTNFTPTNVAWAQRILGLVGMTYQGPADVKEAEKVAWKDTGVLTDYVASTSLAANGTLNNNNFNATNKSLSLTLLDVNASEPVEVTLGGYVLRIAGESSYIYKHHNGADDFRYMMLPVAADGKYDVTVSLQGLYNYIAGTEEVSDNLVGARFTATVNGTTFAEEFGVLDTVSYGVGVSNYSSAAIRVTGAAPAYAEGQPCHVDRAKNIVYSKYGLNGTRIRYYMEDSDGVTVPMTAATGGSVTKADTVETFTLSVGGDVNGDAKVNIKDLIRMKKGALGNVALSDAQKYAATFGQGYELNADALTAFRREILVTEELPISTKESHKLYAGANSNEVSTNLLTNLTIQSGGSVGQGYDHNNKRNANIYTLSSDGTTSGWITQTISNPGKGVYVMSGWSSCSNFFRNDAIEFYSYTLYAQVVYSDGSGEEFYTSFSDGNHDWEYRETSFVVRENASSINFAVFLRDPVRATAKFEGMSLVRSVNDTKTVQDLPMIDQNVAVDTNEISKLDTQDGFGLGLSETNVTGVYVNGTNIAASVAGSTQSGFMVRDVADDTKSVYSFGTTTTDGKNFNGLQEQIGLELDANFTAEEDCVHVTGTVKDLTRDYNGRGIQLSYAIPLSATGWSFQTDLAHNFTVNGAVYKHLGWVDGSWMSNVDWESEAHSYYPAAALTCGDYGIGIAADMDFPTYWELEYNATTNQLVITYQLGLTSEAPDSAKFGFTLYKLDDPTWGFRSAMSKYTKIHPEYYETRATEHGSWIAWQDLSNVPNIEDFNLQFKQAGFDSVAQADIDNGMQTLRYIELGDWWLSNLEAQTNDAIWKKVAEHALEGDGTEKGRQAQANEFCKALNVDGTVVCNYVDRAWAPNGAQLHINPNPNLPGKWNFFNLYYSESNLKLWFDERYVQGAGTFDGIYLDESSGFWVGNANFNRAHFKYTTVPLTYSPYYKRAMLHRASSNWEAMKALRDDLHNRDKIVFANKCPDRNAFFTTLADAMGNEQTVTVDGSYSPLSLQMLSDWRALAYNKPFCLLNSNDWNVVGTAELEQWISRCMLYGIIVSPHDTYNETTEWTQYFTCSNNYFERDRAVWKRYQPVVKTISEAGWEAVTGAYVNNGNVLIERFGDKTEDGATYIVLYNNTNSYQDVTVTVDTNVVGTFSAAQEIVWNNAKPVSGNQITTSLNPGVSYVLKLS